MSDLSSIDKAVQEIRAGKPQPFYLLHGDQDFLVKQAYDRICEALVPPEFRAFNFEQHDGGRVEVGVLLDGLQTLPMMPGPKAVGVMECRFLLSKAQGADLLSKAREKWELGDLNAALRLLAKVLSLAGFGWEEAAAATPAQWKTALAGGEAEESLLAEAWVAKALAQGRGSQFPLPKGGDESQELLEGLEALIKKSDGPAPHLVMSAPSADGRKKLFKFLHARGAVLDFRSSEKGPQAVQAAGSFLQHLLGQKGLHLGSALGQRLLSAYGHDLGLLSQELGKMEAYAHPRRELTDSDLEAVGSPRPEEAIFELLAALGRKDLGRALPLLDAQVRNNPPQMVFAMLVRELRLLFLCRCLVEEGLAPGRGVDYVTYRGTWHPKLCASLPGALAETWKKNHVFVTFQGLNRCRAFALEELRQALEALMEVDLKVKAGGRPLQPLLEGFCISFCGVKEEMPV
jgi:DNA polymerase III delta subunit